MSHIQGYCWSQQRLQKPGGRRFVLPGDEAQWPSDRAFSVDALSAVLRFDLEARAVDGVVQLEIRRISTRHREVALNAVAFSVQAVSQLHAEVREPALYRYDGELLSVDLSDVPVGGVIHLEVVYRCVPQRGLYFVGPDDLRPDRPRQIWSQCQDEDARYFLPCQDHPGQRMRTEMKLRVPAPWQALSNGALADVEDEGEYRVFHWKQEEPHPAYLITVVAGEFERVEDRVDELPLEYWVPLGEGKKIARSFGKTPEMIRCFAERLRTPYPWNKYTQVVVSDFIFGGMENTSATTLFERALVDERAALDVDMDALVAHELAHQWFGDLVTCRDWSQAWLNEGFATYLEHLWKEHETGRDDYLYNLEGDLAAYLAEVQGRYTRPVVTNVYAAPIDLFDRHLYQKGGLIVHALRMEMGDDAFFDGLGLYLSRHRGQGVETRDLLRALEDSSGQSLGAFFHQWVEQAGHPELMVSAKLERRGVALEFSQTQARAEETPFRFEVEVRLRVAGRLEIHRLSVRSAKERIFVPCASEPDLVLVDPEFAVPGKVTLKFPYALLERQLVEAPDARSRWVAARAVAQSERPAAVEALRKALAHDSSWAVRLESAKGLGEVRTSAALNALIGVASDADPRVRKARIEALGEFRRETTAEVLRTAMTEGDASYLVEGAICRSLGKMRVPEDLTRLENAFAKHTGIWGEMVQIGAAQGLVAHRSEEAVMSVVARLEVPGVPDAVARAALQALEKATEIISSRPQLHRLHELAEGYLDRFHPSVRIAAIGLLVGLRDTKAIPVLDRVVSRDLDGRVRRAAREARVRISGQMALSVENSRLRDEVERLSLKVSEISVRLAKTEAVLAQNGEHSDQER